MLGLHVRVDTKELERWAASLSQGEIIRGVRRAVDQSARAARKDALRSIADEIGVPMAKLRATVGNVKGTTQSDLSARWDAKRSPGVGIMNVAGAVFVKGKGLVVSTFRPKQGAKVMLNMPKAFEVRGKKGGRFIAVRTGKGRGAFKGVYAIGPSGVMGYDGSLSRVRWGKAANAELNRRLPIELGKALKG